VDLEVELICSDPQEHRSRVEHRVTDIPGLVVPTWRQVLNREYEPWDRDHLVIDTTASSPDDAARVIHRHALSLALAREASQGKRPDS
jgi:hypothetical protein